MRTSLLLVPVLLSCACVPALAQVTVNLRALDALPHLPPVAAQPASPVRKSPPHHPATTKTEGEASASAVRIPPRTAPPHPREARETARHVTAGAPIPPTHAAARTAAAPSPVPVPPAASLPSAPPPVATLAPVGTPVTGHGPHAAEPAESPKPPIAASAATSAAPHKAGVQLVFAKGKSELSPASADAIKRLAKAAPDTNTTTFNVLAYASGDPSDPSVARRMSLSRAIAVRNALMADGIPSARIYLRALGSPAEGAGPPDRVDINVMGINATSAAAQQ